MTAPAILAELRDLGAKIHLQGADLRVTAAPGERLPLALIERLKGEKPAIVEALRAEAKSELLKQFDARGDRQRTDSSDSSSQRSAAAVREPPPADFKALLRQISKGVDRLEQMSPPGDYREHLQQWAQAVGGARRFLNAGWAGNALARIPQFFHLRGLHSPTT